MSKLFNFLSVISVIGIWPRFVEPYRLRTTQKIWNIDPQHKKLDGIKILHVSDLHFGPHIPDHFLETIVRKCMHHHPDIILFSGDFLCFSVLQQESRMRRFLNRFRAPMGCYAVLGNHDYEQYVSRNPCGHYSIGKQNASSSILFTAIRALFGTTSLSCGRLEEVFSIAMHEALIQLLSDTPFIVLENTTRTINGKLNITGVGEYSLGRCRPETAFKGYDHSLPGIILTHNPDSIPLLLNHPGDWILAGHSHGEQIHFPYPNRLRTLSRSLTRLESPRYSRGYLLENGKHIYTNRGLGSTFPFRFCSSPEILIIEGKVP